SYRAVVDFSVCRKGLGRRRRQDRNLALGRIAPIAGGGDDVEAGRTRFDRRSRESDLSPVAGWNDDRSAGSTCQGGVARPERDLYRLGRAGLVLDCDRQL